MRFYQKKKKKKKTKKKFKKKKKKKKKKEKNWWIFPRHNCFGEFSFMKFRLSKKINCAY